MEGFLILTACIYVTWRILFHGKKRSHKVSPPVTHSRKRNFTNEDGKHPFEYGKKPSHKVSSPVTHSRNRNSTNGIGKYPYEEITWATREEVWTKYERQKGECFFCAVPMNNRDNSRLDYIIPLTRGGKRELENLVVSCPVCNHIKNRRKRNREIWQKRVRAGQRYPARSEVLAIYSRQRRQHRIARAPGSYTQFDIDKIYQRQNGRCKYCFVPLYSRSEYHIDHVRPLARGGTNYPDNLVIACKKCNISKGDKLLQEWTERPVKVALPVKR